MFDFDESIELIIFSINKPLVGDQAHYDNHSSALLFVVSLCTGLMVFAQPTTTEPHSIALGKRAKLTPEFCGFAEARQLFGLSRSHLYRLAEEGRIKSVVLRSKGKLRGRRLFVVESIRDLLIANIN